MAFPGCNQQRFVVLSWIRRKQKCANKRKEVIMSELFASAEVMSVKLNALVKNLMYQMSVTDPNEAVRRVNSGEWIVFQSVRRWREQDNVICSSVTSDGTTGPKWIERFEKKGLHLSKWTKEVLNSPDFKPTEGITTKIAVLKGMLFGDNDRITEKICAEAECRNLIKPNAEVACLIGETFSNKEIETMGLWWIVTMHEPIKDSAGVPRLLSVDRYDGNSRLVARYGEPDGRWRRSRGFAFVLNLWA